MESFANDETFQREQHQQRPLWYLVPISTKSHTQSTFTVPKKERKKRRYGYIETKTVMCKC